MAKVVLVTTKDPDAELDFGVQWARWLNGDTIASSTWTIPAGLTKISDDHDGTRAVVWLSGGVVGNTYLLVNRIVTAGGRTDERAIQLTVEE